MPTEENPAAIWTALADPKRRQIVELLSEKPRTTGELCEFFDVTRFAVMKHLNVLEQAGLITVKRDGRKRWNIINQELVHFLTAIQNPGGEDSFKFPKSSGQFQARLRNVGEPALGKTPPIQLDLFLDAAPCQVFRALTTEINHWWIHQTTPGSLGMQIEPVVNGRFYEAFDDHGQGELYGIVTYIRQDHELRLRGSMGAEDESVTSIVRFLLEPEDGGTQVILQHCLTGPADVAVIDSFRDRWDNLLNDKLKEFLNSNSCRF